MAAIDPDNAGEYNANAANFFDLYLKQTIPYTPGGLAYPYHWGALRPTTQVCPQGLNFLRVQALGCGRYRPRRRL